MDAEQILAFRRARSGLARRQTGSLAKTAACPASDFARDGALLALAARHDGFSRQGYAEAVARGDLVVAHIVRGAIHAVAPGDFGLYGRALLSSDADELSVQLGQQMRRLAAEKGFDPAEALTEVAEATKDALAGGRALGKNELHEELRRRVHPDLMPWCKGCNSYHVAPMLWRYGTVVAGARLDFERRYLLGKPGRAPGAEEVVRRFLGFYGPSTVGEFADWAGLAKPHARRLWERVEGELSEVSAPNGRAWVLSADLGLLETPPRADGLRLIPASDPYLQKPNRPLLAPDAALRRRVFRPVASPGAVIVDGRLAGLWRARAKGKKVEIAVEGLEQIPQSPLEQEAQRIAELRSASDALVTV